MNGYLFFCLYMFSPWGRNQLYRSFRVDILAYLDWLILEMAVLGIGWMIMLGLLEYWVVVGIGDVLF